METLRGHAFLRWGYIMNVSTWKDRITPISLLAAIAVVAAISPASNASAEPLAVNNGDRIALIGTTFFEREGRYGCIETLMTAHFRDLDLTFRNLGWSGDEVNGIARASFDSIEMGYERLIQQAKDVEPNIILLNYGANESFQGEAGLETFNTGLNKLINDLSVTKARVVLVSPPLQENLGAPYPDPAAHNADILLYTKVMAQIAADRNLMFVNMAKLVPVFAEVTKKPRTDNGLHFTEEGYWEVAPILLAGLGYDVGKADRAQLQPMRKVIIEKNRLFFNKWRPQNATYITGFRKHEQGRHVAEFPMFDPLVAEQEARIAQLRNALPPKGQR